MTHSTDPGGSPPSNDQEVPPPGPDLAAYLLEPVQYNDGRIAYVAHVDDLDQLLGFAPLNPGGDLFAFCYHSAAPSGTPKTLGPYAVVPAPGASAHAIQSLTGWIPRPGQLVDGRLVCQLDPDPAYVDPNTANSGDVGTV
jgi:hypothetical protein